MQKLFGWALVVMAMGLSTAAQAAEEEKNLVLVEPAFPGTTLTGHYERALNDRLSIVGGLEGNFSIQSYEVSINGTVATSQNSRMLSAELEAGPNWYLLGRAFDGLWIGARVGAGWTWTGTETNTSGNGFAFLGGGPANGWRAHAGAMIGYTQPLAKSLHVSVAAELLGSTTAPSTTQGFVTSTTTQWSISPRLRFGLGWAF